MIKYPTCSTCCNGEISIEMGAANKPYLFSIDDGATWSGPDVFSGSYKTFKNLCVGEYHIRVKLSASSGCLITKRVVLDKKAPEEDPPILTGCPQDFIINKNNKLLETIETQLSEEVGIIQPLMLTPANPTAPTEPPNYSLLPPGYNLTRIQLSDQPNTQYGPTATTNYDTRIGITDANTLSSIMAGCATPFNTPKGQIDTRLLTGESANLYEYSDNVAEYHNNIWEANYNGYVSHLGGGVLEIVTNEQKALEKHPELFEVSDAGGGAVGGTAGGIPVLMQPNPTIIPVVKCNKYSGPGTVPPSTPPPTNPPPNPDPPLISPPTDPPPSDPVENTIIDTGGGTEGNTVYTTVLDLEKLCECTDCIQIKPVRIDNLCNPSEFAGDLGDLTEEIDYVKVTPYDDAGENCDVGALPGQICIVFDFPLTEGLGLIYGNPNHEYYFVYDYMTPDMALKCSGEIHGNRPGVTDAPSVATCTDYSDFINKTLDWIINRYPSDMVISSSKQSGNKVLKICLDKAKYIETYREDPCVLEVQKCFRQFNLIGGSGGGIFGGGIPKSVDIYPSLDVDISTFCCDSPGLPSEDLCEEGFNIVEFAFTDNINLNPNQDYKITWEAIGCGRVKRFETIKRRNCGGGNNNCNPSPYLDPLGTIQSKSLWRHNHPLDPVDHLETLYETYIYVFDCQCDCIMNRWSILSINGTDQYDQNLDVSLEQVISDTDFCSPTGLKIKFKINLATYTSYDPFRITILLNTGSNCGSQDIELTHFYTFHNSGS